MSNIEQILERNTAWAEQVSAGNPDFFKTLAEAQHPDFLWIGCSDSRVPASRVADLKPGQVFVHRNIANVVAADDLNCQSVLQYAVQALKVKHIIVCGHFGCGGVCASLSGGVDGAIDQWLDHVRAAHAKHADWVDAAADQAEKEDRMCMANVLEQAMNVCETSVVNDAWASGQVLSVHGLIYGLHDGRIRDLGFSVSSSDELQPRYEQVISQLKVGAIGKLSAD